MHHVSSRDNLSDYSNTKTTSSFLRGSIMLEAGWLWHYQRVTPDHALRFCGKRGQLTIKDVCYCMFLFCCFCKFCSDVLNGFCSWYGGRGDRTTSLTRATLTECSCPDHYRLHVDYSEPSFRDYIYMHRIFHFFLIPKKDNISSSLLIFLLTCGLSH